MEEIYQWSQTLSVEDYVSGLEKIAPKMNETQRKLLIAQYHTPNRTAYATQLAELASIKGGYPIVNRQYGGLGHLFCDITGFSADKRDDGSSRWWSILSIGHNTRQGFVWEMLPNVARALDVLGWVSVETKEKELLSSTNTKLEEAVKKSLMDTSATRQKRLKNASRIPKKLAVMVYVFDRNPDVVAEVLVRANGYCEQCKEPAPFNRKSDGSPYLEVHHRKPLADNGEDTVENAIALCPNCHRRAHYG